MPLIFAHQGGWDEMLMVAVPIGLFAGLLSMANRRAEATREDRNKAAADPPDDDPDPTDQ